MTLLAIEDLSVRSGEHFLLKNIRFRIGRGEIVGLLGESGSGKSTLARSILRLLPQEVITTGVIRLGSTNLTTLSEKQMNGYRGHEIAFVGQDSLLFLDPLMTIGNHIVESLKATSKNTEKQSEHINEALAWVDLPTTMANLYPSNLSGGQRQRAALAIALASKPRLLIADEPTSALDALTEREIMAIFSRITEGRHTAILLISHNAAMVSHRADRIIVLKNGEIIEKKAARKWWSAPSHPYSQALIKADQALRIAPLITEKQAQSPLTVKRPLLEISHLCYQRDKKVVLDDINLKLFKGDRIALVGESGAGKSTLLKVILGILPILSGEIRVQDQAISFHSHKERIAFYRKVQAVFQDPASSLDPRWRIAKIIGEPLALYKERFSSEEKQNRISLALEALALPSTLQNDYPSTLSGGQQQRVAIARALINKPEILLLDEAFSALDTINRLAISKQLINLSEKNGMGCLLVTHDLTLARFFATRIMILHNGHVIENNTVETVFTAPAHYYTQKLIQAWRENYNI
ncbi:MAG: ABC transporter ATP-binding protein [Zymomonas mobilis subsp. pomaceae]|uniref:ABC transporter ATP-binding protein n=1 Tax=Zymomonas mobilis TaxID=542 RepID=UPI0039EC4B4A